MNSEIRIGRVSSINYDTGMMRVTYTDKGKSTTSEFPFMNYNDEYYMPSIGSTVAVAHMSNGSSRGIVLGNVWNKRNIPNETGKKLYRKELSKTKNAAFVRYDDETGEYLLKSSDITLNGINKTTIEGPKIIIEANISYSLDAPKTSMKSKDHKFSCPVIEIGTAPEYEEDPPEEMEITNNCDTKIIMNERDFEALINRIVLETRENLELKANKEMRFESKLWKTSLDKIMDRLAALDGDQSEKK